MANPIHMTHTNVGPIDPAFGGQAGGATQQSPILLDPMHQIGHGHSSTHNGVHYGGPYKGTTGPFEKSYPSHSRTPAQMIDHEIIVDDWGHPPIDFEFGNWAPKASVPVPKPLPSLPVPPSGPIGPTGPYVPIRDSNSLREASHAALVNPQITDSVIVPVKSQLPMEPILFVALITVAAAAMFSRR